MKKLIILSILFISVNFIFAQTQNATTENGKKVILNSDGTWKYLEVKKDSLQPKNDIGSLVILHAIDKMTDKNYYSLSEPLIFQKGDKQLLVRPSIDDKGKYSTLSIVTVNVGNCNENNKIIFLFEDDTKLSLDSWSEFNCRGVSYYDLYGKSLTNLQKKVKSIMYQNGKSYESITVDLSESEQDYFIQVQNAIDKKLFVAAHLEDGKLIKD